METFSMLLALCEGNPPFTGGFPLQRPVMHSFDVLHEVRLDNDWANSGYASVIWDAMVLIVTSV